MNALAAHLAWVDPWLLPLDAHAAWPISRLEAAAALLSLAMVGHAAWASNGSNHGSTQAR